MIYHTTFYRNKSSLVFHKTRVLSDKIGGYLLDSKLLRTYRVDGTDTGFRNVGQLQFDAGEIPKRKYTVFKSVRKSEIKNI